MTLKELVRQLRGRLVCNWEGIECPLQLLPPLSDKEMELLATEIPCPIPDDVRDLLAYSRGFKNGPLGGIDFSGLGGFGMEELFPGARPLGQDECGNCWIADLTSQSNAWGPILYVCHDPPVCIHQSNSFEHFIHEALRGAMPPYESELKLVQEVSAHDIWSQNPGLLTVASCRASPDPLLREFADFLDESFMIYDMRSALIGNGFSWGRFGPKTRVMRFGEERLFTYQVSKSPFRRLLGW